MLSAGKCTIKRSTNIHYPSLTHFPPLNALIVLTCAGFFELYFPSELFFLLNKFLAVLGNMFRVVVFLTISRGASFVIGISRACRASIAEATDHSTLNPTSLCPGRQFIVFSKRFVS